MKKKTLKKTLNKPGRRPATALAQRIHLMERAILVAARIAQTLKLPAYRRVRVGEAYLYHVKEHLRHARTELWHLRKGLAHPRYVEPEDPAREG